MIMLKMFPTPTKINLWEQVHKNTMEVQREL